MRLYSRLLNDKECRALDIDPETSHAGLFVFPRVSDQRFSAPRTVDAESLSARIRSLKVGASLTVPHARRNTARVIIRQARPQLYRTETVESLLSDEKELQVTRTA